MSDPNRELFERVVLLLRPVLDELVFVGGCATGLLVTDAATGGIRPTKDVDAIVDVTSYAKYAELSERLRAVGLVEDAREGAISHDLEDIIAIIDGRPEIVGEIERSSADVRTYIGSEVSQLLNNRTFMDSLSGFLNPDSASQARRPLIETRLRALTE